MEITIIGLGYVGLPLAVAFGQKYNTTGIDINSNRVKELKKGIDRTNELNIKEILNVKHLKFLDKFEFNYTTETMVYIVTVPTPIDIYKNPDISYLLSATKSIGEMLKKNDIVIYESTVYPGCTEEDCVPILEKYSGLVYNIDFFCGYSPERINPGDKERPLTKILKITSGSNPEIAETIDQLYKSVIEAGTFKATTIKVAEAAKLIENCQRDVNISFVNELSLIFDKMNINTYDVLEAAGTKWNFLKFNPGLVGGHCIGVDPYYMIHKAESLGYHPALIGAGRRINDNMGIFVVNKILKQMIKNGKPIKKSNALLLGFTFKENCPDIRNTRVIDIYNELTEFGINVDVHDHWALKDEVKNEYKLTLINKLKNKYDIIIISVAHEEFKHNEVYLNLYKKASLLFDLKAILNKRFKALTL